MDMTLRPETRQMIEERMKRGGYTTPDDLIRAALELLDARTDDELDAEDLAAIVESEQQIAAGEDLDWAVVSAELRKKYS